MFDTFLVDIKAWFNTNLTPKPDKYVAGDYPDVDMNKEPTVIYIQTPDFEFEELTNESKEMKGMIEMYVILQKNTQDNLKQKALLYLDLIYSLIKSKPTMGGLVDYSMISQAKVYDGVEGTPNVRGIYVRIEFVKEI